MKTVFISYSRRNSAEIQALAAALRNLRIAVWLDTDEIADAAAIQRSIDTGLAQAHAVIAWYSEDYPLSRACQWELTAALLTASAETGAYHRLLIVNPCARTAHIHPADVRDLQHFAATGDYAALAQQLAACLAPLDGTLGAIRRLQNPVWHGYHGLGSNRFVGRVDDLWKIHSALAASRFAIVSGLPAPQAAGELAQVRGSGGLGKSLLAEEYALRFGSYWSGGIFWLRAYGNPDSPAQEPEQLGLLRGQQYTRQLAQFATDLGLETRELDDSGLYALLKRTLQHQGQPYLWVVDDLPACDRQELEQWLAPSANGQTLITTRSRRLDSVGARIDLAVLPPADARALLTRQQVLAPQDEAHVVAILEYLNGHALALDLARAACRHLGYASFRARLDNPSRDALDLAAELADELPNEHGRYIAATFLGSIAQIREDALDCLRLASQLATAPIPRELVTASLVAADAFAEEEAAIVAAKGIKQLLEHSLAEASEDDQAFSVHNLLSRTMLFHDQDQARRTALLNAVHSVLVAAMQRAGDIREHPTLLALIAHVQILAAPALQAQELGHPIGETLIHWLGRFEFEAGRYRLARQWEVLAVERCLHLFGPEHSDTLTTMNNLAVMLRAMGELAEARAMHKQVLEARQRVLGPEHPELLASMNNLAEVLRDVGEFAEARAMHEHALEIRQRVLGPENPDTLTNMNNLAVTLVVLGERAEASAMHKQVLETRQRVLGPTHPDTLISMGNLAETLSVMGDLVEARAMQTQVVETLRCVLGPEHPVTLTSMNNLAHMLGVMKDFAKARAIEELVLEARQRVLGPHHPDMLTSMSNLAVTLKAMGELAEARVMQEQVLEILQGVLGPEHPSTLIIMSNLAETLRVMGELPKARALHEQVLEIRQRVLGPIHAYSVESIGSLANILESMNDVGAALDMYSRLYEAVSLGPGVETPRAMWCIWKKGLMLARLGQVDITYSLLSDNLDAYRRVFGPDHPNTQALEQTLTALATQLSTETQTIASKD